MPRGGKRPGAGRKKGYSAIQAEKLREYLIKEIIKEKGPLIKALIEKGKLGDVSALKELFDRSAGKVTDKLDIDLSLEDIKELSQSIKQLARSK